ncbi:MAG: efflux RND transporter permease subunit, partial [Bacteroidales bacterium]
VLENITKHIERGSRPQEAAIYGTNEVWVSVIASTLVVVAVFLPLTTLSGMVGIMFSELGWIVTITVVTSTIAAITLTPMLSAKLLKLQDSDVRLTGFARFHQKYIEKKLDALDAFYERTLRWALGRKKIIMIGTMSFFVASLFLFKFVGTDFMPETDEGRFSATVEVATGLRVEETLKTTAKLEKLLKERYPEVTIVSSSTGADDEGGFSSLFGNSGTNTISLTIRLLDLKDRDRSVFEIANDFREQLKQFPEIVEYTVSTGGGSSSMGGGGNNVSVEIYGYDLNATNKVAQEIKTKLSELEGAKDITISRKKDKPELCVDLDKEKMAQNGLSSAMVSSFLRNRVGGMISSIYREDGEEYDIVVRLSEEYRSAVTNIEDISIMTPQGKSIKLKELGDVKENWGPPNIERKRRERIVKVDVTPVGVPLGTLATQIQDKLKEVQVPDDMLIELSGAYEDQQESFADMGMLLVLIFALVFIVMASQFESFSKPFVIAFAIPFAFTGVILALLITGTTLNMIASLGAILLVG